MNERIVDIAIEANSQTGNEFDLNYKPLDAFLLKFAEGIQEDMYRKVIASILITDVIMEEKSQKPTSEDYISAINKDFNIK